jgi:hypothetical protein
MIRVAVVPRARQNLYGMLVKREVALRRQKTGTLHRWASKQKGEEKWHHTQYPGWIRFQKCIGGSVVALVQARNAGEEWQLLSSFIGFLDRHFRESIANINICYEIVE